MAVIINIDNDLDLKCDFPARESFKSSLLERLQLLNEQETVSEAEDPGEIRLLSDEALDMLAAAGDPALLYQDPTK